jgi:asparagine synthase (glutamine-hydrolysing)
MAHGLELRVPFLDHKMVEFAATLPVESKLNGSGKVLLRKAMRGVLPAPIIDRPKKGFPIPIASWLRGPMRDFTRGHLVGRHSASSQYMDKAIIGRIVKEHEQGRVDRSAEIWTMLMFECWHEQFIDQGNRALAPALAASYGGIS